MNTETMRGLIELARRHGLAEIEYAEGEERVRFAFHTVTETYVPLPPIEPPSVFKESKGREVHSALTGIFYRASAPDQPPFVQVGDQVEPGQTLAIIEAMKMLNPLEADQAGRITQILVEDGSSVAPGQTLMIIEEAI